MGPTEFDIRQSVLRSALNMAGTAVNAQVDSILIATDPLIGKLFEDRNLTLDNGGIIALSAAGNSVTFTSALTLQVNSQIAGGAPTLISLGSSTAAFTANLNMLYAVINRTLGTAVVTADASTLPVVNNANQEVVLIAKRVDSTDGTKRVYFRNGQALSAGQSSRLGGVGTVYASEFSIVDATDTTKKIVFQASGSTTATSTTLFFSQTANRVITFPDATTTVVGTDTTQILSNKQIQFSVSTDSTTTGSDATLAAFTTGVVRLTNGSLLSVGGIPAGASGQLVIIENKTGLQITINNEDLSDTAANRIQTGTGAPVSMPNNATFMFTYDTTSARWELTGGSGSGSGGGSKNYLTSITTSTNGGIPNVGNGNLELGTTTGWSEFTTAMTGVIPSGVISAGDAAHTLSVVTGGAQLSGNYSLDWASTTTTGTAGEGFISDPFFIDKSDQVKILSFSFNYNLIGGSNLGILNFSGTSANTFAVYIYDVTNSKWIQPVGVYNMTQSAGTQFVTGSFQTTSNSTEYRLAVLIANSFAPTSTTMYFDDFSVGPNGPFSSVIDPMTANVGSILLSASATAPPGFLPCDGTAYSRTQYAALFSAIGITHGQGNGSTTFNVPDYRARFIRGTDNMGGPAGAAGRDPDVGTRTAMAAGGNTGNAVGSIQGSIFASHGHALITSGPGDSFVSNNVASAMAMTVNGTLSYLTNAVVGGNPLTQASGGTETRPINAYGQFYIRYLPQVAGNGIGITGAVAFNAEASAFSVPSGAGVNGSFPTVLTDTNSAFNGTDTYVIPVSGIYNFECNGYYFYNGALGTGTWFIGILKNGVTIGTQFQGFLESVSANNAADASIQGIVCNAGDLITIHLQHNTASASISYSGNFSAVLQGGGVQANQARIFQAPTMQVFTAGQSGTYVFPVGALYAEVELLGGGGGGGGAVPSANAPGGGGGGAGGYGKTLITPAALTSFAYSVGTGGAGAAVGGSGSAGGNTTFGTLTAHGGGGGGEGFPASNYFGTPGQGGSVTGTFNGVTSFGGHGATAATLNTSNNVGGPGGASYFGSGSYGFDTNTGPTTPVNALALGSGGGGGGSSGGSVGGTNGAGGVLIIKTYFQ